MLAEIPLALRQQHDIAPPGESPLLLDAGTVDTLQFCFLAQVVGEVVLSVTLLESFVSGLRYVSLTANVCLPQLLGQPGCHW